MELISYILLVVIIGGLIIFLPGRNKKQLKIEDKVKKRKVFVIVAIVLGIVSLIIPLLITIYYVLLTYVLKVNVVVNTDFIVEIAIPVIIIIICSIISYIILKIKSIKEKNSNEDTIKKIKLNKKFIFITLAILIIIMSLKNLIELDDVFIESEMDDINIKGIIVMIGLIITVIMQLVSIIPIIKEKKRVIFVISIIIGIIFINCVDVLQDLRKEDKYKYGFVSYQFNYQFEVYAGEEVRGSTVRALALVVLANNVDADDEVRKVNIYGAVTLNKEDTSLSQSGYSDIDTSKTYKVEMIYNKYGKIESIYIEENQ